jgi:hypothetical protein
VVSGYYSAVAVTCKYKNTPVETEVFLSFDFGIITDSRLRGNDTEAESSGEACFDIAEAN